jgi:hypothetical protein
MHMPLSADLEKYPGQDRSTLMQTNYASATIAAQAALFASIKFTAILRSGRGHAPLSGS